MKLGEEERWFLVCGAYGELRRLGRCARVANQEGLRCLGAIESFDAGVSKRRQTGFPRPPRHEPAI